MIYLNKALLENTSLSEYAISKLNEEEKSNMADKLISKMYKDIQKRSKDIDIPEIQGSRGDISKVTGYKDLKNAIKYLEKVAEKSSNEDFKEVVKDLNDTEQFLIKYKDYFIKAYVKNNFILKSCYVSTAGMLTQLTAYIISNCLIFESNGVMFEVKARKSTPKLKKHTGYKCLKEILNLAKKQKLDKNFNDCLSLNEATITIAWLGVTLLLLTSIRGIIYVFLTSRIKLSEYIDMVKNYVELNQSNIRDPQIKQKQQKWVDRLEKLRDKISIDQEMASSRAREELEEDNDNNGINDKKIPNDDLGLL